MSPLNGAFPDVLSVQATFHAAFKWQFNAIPKPFLSHFSATKISPDSSAPCHTFSRGFLWHSNGIVVPQKCKPPISVAFKYNLVAQKCCLVPRSAVSPLPLLKPFST